MGLGDGSRGENDPNAGPALRAVTRTLRMVMGNAGPAQAKGIMPSPSPAAQ